LRREGLDFTAEQAEFIRAALRCAESNRRELTAPEVLCRGADSDTPIVPFLPHAGMNARGRSLDGARRTGLRRWKEAVRPDR
jgi:hypothetical protein